MHFSESDKSYNSYPCPSTGLIQAFSHTWWWRGCCILVNQTYTKVLLLRIFVLVASEHVQHDRQAGSGVRAGIVGDLVGVLLLVSLLLCRWMGPMDGYRSWCSIKNYKDSCCPGQSILSWSEIHMLKTTPWWVDEV